MHTTLNSGIQYLYERGVDKVTIQTFKLGAVLGNSFYRYSKDFDEVWTNYIMDKTASLEGNLVFPVMDVLGTTRGVLFRGIKEKKFSYNSGFSKSQQLYGIHASLESIFKNKFAILVEGIFDVLVGHAMGYKNVIGVLGNQITRNQAYLLRRFTSKVLVFPDGDDGGILLAKQSKRILSSMGMEVKSISVDGKDPDEIFSQGGLELKKLGYAYTDNFLLRQAGKFSGQGG